MKKTNKEWLRATKPLKKKKKKKKKCRPHLAALLVLLL
jgi:hypothetical protein